MYLKNIYKHLNIIISATSNWILMIYGSLDSSYQDESNDSKIIQIRVIFVEIAIFSKILGQVGLGRVNCMTQPEISVKSGRVPS